MSKPKSGTREWSEHSANCCTGCRHGCLYCYAAEMAARFGRIPSREAWTKEVPRRPTIRASRKYTGRIMFPTTHDITEGNAGACLDTLVALLAAGNDVLVVSKAGPHVAPLLVAARELAGDRGRLELRVSLTHLNPAIGKLWEPGAPTAIARCEALGAADAEAIPTSISIEPLLEPTHATEIVKNAFWSGGDGGATGGEIWIGAANQLRKRTAWCRDLPGLEAEVQYLECWQVPERMREVFERVRRLGLKQVRWKDSYQRALGIDERGEKRA